LGDLLEVIDRRLELPEASDLGLDSKRYLRWQLHTIAPEVLRTLAIELAHDEGLQHP
jgi:hypothetical protein